MHSSPRTHRVPVLEHRPDLAARRHPWCEGTFPCVSRPSEWAPLPIFELQAQQVGDRLWQTLVKAAFSFLGTEIVALTAGEAEK